MRLMNDVFLRVEPGNFIIKLTKGAVHMMGHWLCLIQYMGGWG
jgi:hypothetical protein